MLQTEFVRSLNSNYERILLDKSPEEKRYQYCMLSRGGIKGLLPCTLRYINGLGYLYYDITSKQNVAQLYGKRVMTRKWVKDFMWSIQQIREELSRFLLEEQNILWYPQQVYQDLESNMFSFLFVPYYVGDNGFGKMLEFMIEHIDYEDDTLVECVYKMYEQFEMGGQDYLHHQIFKDVEMLEETINNAEEENAAEEVEWLDEMETTEENVQEKPIKEISTATEKQSRKGIRNIFRGKFKREKPEETYPEMMQQAMNGYAVAEDSFYESEEWGKTVYIEEAHANKKKEYCLYTPEGKIVSRLDKDSLIIGKKREEADVVLEEASVSRMHARIDKEDDTFYLEDLNSTNGTYKNGLQLKPYERRELEPEDEIRIGKQELIFRLLTY